MVNLASTFLDSSLALHSGIYPAPSCLPRSRSFSHVLALASPSFSDGLEFARSADQESPFKPKPRWWIPFLPGAPAEWSSDSKISEERADSAHSFQANNLHMKPGSEVTVACSPKKSGGRARKVVFTPEMARKLRKQMKSDDDYHDFMYHSAIATRLASNVS